MLTPPTFEDVLLARKVIAPHLPHTPLHHYPALSKLLAAEVYVKHENHQPVGAFKVRGGVNLISRLGPEERARGVIAASTGNHGQSVAFGGRLFGVRAIIGVPQGANPGKVEAMRDLGAELIFHGRDFDEARCHVEELAAREGYRYIHSGDEPLLIAGVGTYALEILEDQPGIEAIIVSVGGGSGASGCCLVAKAVNRRIQVIGVQAEKAPAAYRSWKEGRLVEDKMETFAEGLATRTAFALPQSILREHLDDFILVSEEELRRAILLCLEKTHNLAEGAGAAPLAAALRLKDRLRGKKVALVMSGGNISPERLREVLSG
jgi:threonine dehydratase